MVLCMENYEHPVRKQLPGRYLLSDSVTDRSDQGLIKRRRMKGTSEWEKGLKNTERKNERVIKEERKK